MQDDLPCKHYWLDDSHPSSTPQDSHRPRVTMHEEACVDNAADTETADFAWTVIALAATYQAEGANVLYLPSEAKEPANGI